MNPYSATPACQDCGDTRIITKNVRANRDSGHIIPCPRCGADPHPNGPESDASRERYEHFKKTAWAARQKQPDITLLDLSEAELTIRKRLKDENPHASPTTILSWLEGQRYQAKDDQEFLKEMESRVPTAQQEVDAHLGPTPNWIEMLEAGKHVEINASQKAFYEVWKERKCG